MGSQDKDRETQVSQETLNLLYELLYHPDYFASAENAFRYANHYLGGSPRLRPGQLPKLTEEQGRLVVEILQSRFRNRHDEMMSQVKRELRDFC